MEDVGRPHRAIGQVGLALHEEKTRLATQRLTALLVPAMTILMGVAVGGIVASLMTAMLSLNNLASG